MRTILILLLFCSPASANDLEMQVFELQVKCEKLAAMALAQRETIQELKNDLSHQEYITDVLTSTIQDLQSERIANANTITTP